MPRFLLRREKPKIDSHSPRDHNKTVNQLIAQILQANGIDPSTTEPSQHPGILYITVPGERAVPIWQSLRTRFDATGVWPIIRGDADDDIEQSPQDTAEILVKIPVGSPSELLASRLAERIQLCIDLVDCTSPTMDAATLAAKLDASGAMSFGGIPNSPEPWPTASPSSEPFFHSVINFRTNKPHPQIRLALISLAHPHEAPAYLSFGGWNDAPMPELQAAMLREWNRRYGALPIAITGDVLECFVERPPKTEVDSMNLAIEQWLFCDDIVGQGTETVRKLATELWQSPKWFFWWD